MESLQKYSELMWKLDVELKKYSESRIQTDGLLDLGKHLTFSGCQLYSTDLELGAVKAAVRSYLKDEGRLGLQDFYAYDNKFRFEAAVDWFEQ
ncbi:hypothetical protein Y1Q_0017904 [Alligator mississippiensis]|uniref:Uncharacterized protein n=1 Tax=Alligator mississippiensis TaxID=8496 RepID=A0A151MXV1_ALLMI|nr:hypothetical protein Y1Q_0017904 [Alligator mississippiensis]